MFVDQSCLFRKARHRYGLDQNAALFHLLLQLCTSNDFFACARDIVRPAPCIVDPNVSRTAWSVPTNKYDPVSIEPPQTSDRRRGTSRSPDEGLEVTEPGERMPKGIGDFPFEQHLDTQR
jgi:hypothetical protein